jgi:hypothetical protein
VNVDTQVQQSTVADGAGIYHFLSLAPGKYQVTATSSGFSETKVDFVLRTDENRNIVVVLTVASASTNVVVTGEAPLVDVSDSRNELTLETEELQSFPLFALNPTVLISLTPGVTGLGAGTANNFFTAGPDVSAGGRGRNSDLYILDGLDINIDVNQGVLALVPNSDAISEMTVQTNTYAVDYGRVSSLQTVMTTKSGTTAYHGSASEYYQYEGLNARGEFGTPQPTPTTCHSAWAVPSFQNMNSISSSDGSRTYLQLPQATRFTNMKTRHSWLLPRRRSRILPRFN